jgi:AcrR family transcriptional regulator
MKNKSKNATSVESEAELDKGAALLDSAREIFINEGVKGLSVRRLAEAAGCTTMTVYSRFKGKDEILGALFDEGFERLSAAQQAINPKLKDTERLLALCKAYRVVAHDYPHHYALMLGQFSGELTPSQSSREKALATLETLTVTVAAMPSAENQSRAVSAAIANRLFAFCHGWVSLERIGFFGDQKSVDKQFGAAVLALLK